MLTRASPNHDARRVPIDMLVIHYTGMEPAGRAIDWLCDPASKVSAHYLIDRDGAVTAMVAEERRAWHAGIAWWRGHADINARSVGIELANPGHDFGYDDFPAAQIAALIGLARGIVARHAVPPRNIVGHSDIAPGRKIDPGERFPWRALADAGLGVWPDPDATPPPGALAAAADLADTLAAIGYPVAEAGLPACRDAFRRRYCPDTVTGAAIHGDAADDPAIRRAAATLLARLVAEPALSYI
jgi:N-acetylmuramoyl-L-alanine amidase